MYAIRSYYALADLVDHTALHLVFGENGLDGIGKTAQTIDGSDEHILNTTVLQVGDHR